MTPPPSTAELEAVLGARDFLRRLARGLVLDEQRAEDLVQETCARALEERPSQPGALRRWMASVLRHLAIDEGLRERARPQVEARAARDEAVWAAEERDLELERHVLEAVQGLRQPYRTAIYLRYYRGLSPPAIARRLDEPVATVKTRLRRGLELLREELDRRHGGERGVWCAALVVLALPELVGAGAGSISAGTALEGLALMNKPLVVTLSAAVLAAVATVAWNLREAGEAGRAEPAPAVALSPQAGAPEAPAPMGPRDAAAAEAARQAAARSALSAEPAAAPATIGAGVGLTGRVVDESGAPVAGAELRAERGAYGFFAEGESAELEPAVAESAADGRFRLPVPEDGTFRLVIAAAGFAPFSRDVPGYYDLETELGDLELTTGVVLAGRVVDTDGAPIAGAELRAVRDTEEGRILFGGSDLPLAVTDAAGRFVVDRHPVGPYSLEARSPRHPGATIEGETQRPGQRVDELELVLRKGATITGRLTGAPATLPEELYVHAGRKESEAGASGAVRVFNFGDGFVAERVARVQPDGRFELAGLEPGQRYRLRARDTEESFGGRSFTGTTEADAGARDVELAWTPGASIALQAVDARSGAPIESFELDAGLGWAQPFTRGGERVTQHPDGRARIEELRLADGSDSAKATVAVRAPGYEPFERDDVVVQRGRETDLGVVRLSPVPMARVTVLDELGRPVAGATVRLRALPAPGEDVSFDRRVGVGPRGASSSTRTSLASREGRTDEQGVARLSSLPGERAQLSVSAPRFADWRSETLELPVADDLERTVRLERGAVVEVQVLDASGAPVPSARVAHRPPEDDPSAEQVFLGPTDSRVTDPQGRVFFRNLRAGRHGFRIDDGDGGGFVVQGGGMATASIRIGGSNEKPYEEHELAAGETLAITLQQGLSTSLSGLVTEGGAPLADAELRLVAGGDSAIPGLSGGGPSTRTDERGNYAFDGLEPGEYELVVSHPSRALPHKEPVQLRPGGERYDLDLDVAILEGRVEDLEGRPIAGAKVRAERVAEGPERRVAFVMISGSTDGGGGEVVVGGGDDVEPARTDAEGRFELRGLPPGVTLRVRAEAEGHAPGSSEPFELERDERRAGLELKLRPAGSIAVEVRRADAAPASQVLARLERLDVESPGGAPNLRVTDKQGRARFTDLEPGRYKVVADPIGSPGGGAESPELLVVAGEETPVLIDLP